jgi:hypothetical protein
MGLAGPIDSSFEKRAITQITIFPCLNLPRD